MADPRLPGGGDVGERLLPQGETRTRAVRQARRLVCPVAVRYLGSSGAAVARFLGVTTSAVTHAAWTEPIPGAAEFV